MYIIGIAGKKQTGKDLVADYLCAEFGFVKVSFAEPLKVGLQAMLGLDDAYVWGDKKEHPIPWIPRPYTFRQAMTEVGTDYFRDRVFSNIWIFRANDWIKELTSQSHEHIVISDIRFDNEAAWVRQMGHVWHLHRGDCTSFSSSSSWASRVWDRLRGVHASEKGVNKDPMDRVLLNNSTITDLYTQVDFLLEEGGINVRKRSDIQR